MKHNLSIIDVGSIHHEWILNCPTDRQYDPISRPDMSDNVNQVSLWIMNPKSDDSNDSWVAITS